LGFHERNSTQKYLQKGVGLGFHERNSTQKYLQKGVGLDVKTGNIAG
jgi:hypothetical protein